MEETSGEALIHTVVSGALDRLHYEADPCVKYDLDKKLWIYLHSERDLGDLAWKPVLLGVPENS